MSTPPETNTATEKCGCGASFTVTSKTLLAMKKALQDWRDNHRHPAPADDRPEVHAVTGTHHQAGDDRRQWGRRRPIGFQLTTKETQ